MMQPLGKAISIGIVHFFLQAFAPLLFMTVYLLAFKCIKKFKKIVYLFRFSSYKQVQSQHQLVGFLLPVITFIPVLILLNKTENKN